MCREGKAPLSPARTIGVLDLQGGVCEHIDHLHRLGIEARTVKQIKINAFRFNGNGGR